MNHLVFFEPPCCRRGVTPHSEIIVADEPPCIFWTTLLQKGGHTPFWNHSGRWTTLYLSNPVGFCIAIPYRRSLSKVCSCLIDPSTSTPKIAVISWKLRKKGDEAGSVYVYQTFELFSYQSFNFTSSSLYSHWKKSSSVIVKVFKKTFLKAGGPSVF